MWVSTIIVIPVGEEVSLTAVSLKPATLLSVRYSSSLREQPPVRIIMLRSDWSGHEGALIRDIGAQGLGDCECNEGDSPG
jgi:hypothetical protein